MTTPKERLHEIRESIDMLEKEQTAIYAASLKAPEQDKVCEDFIAKMLGGPHLPKFQFPIEVNGLTSNGEVVQKGLFSEAGSWVAVRPCDEACKGQTYLGLLLGDIALSFGIRFNRRDGILCVSPSFHNPAIFVFDLGKIVFGCESWWGPIKGPDDLKQITNKDIDNVWYVQALKAMSAGQKPVASTDGPREMTTDEVREVFLDHVRSMCKYWVEESRAATEKAKVEGVAFSILAALDGENVGLPGFIVAPSSHPEDKEYHRSRGENWYPENNENYVKCDIGGSLHERFHK